MSLSQQAERETERDRERERAYCFTSVMHPTFKRLYGHVGFDLSVHVCVHPFHHVLIQVFVIGLKLKFNRLYRFLVRKSLPVFCI